jgi:hypothetical protein
MDFALWHLEVDALEDYAAIDSDFEALDLKDGIGQLRSSPGC